MATYNADINVGLTAGPDTRAVEKIISELLQKVDKLPTATSNASKAIQELVGQIKKIKGSLENTGSLNSVIGETKALGASLKVINTLQKGLALFDNKDIANINSYVTQLRQAATAYERMQRASQIKEGTFGMDEKQVSGVVKATQSLKRELNGIQQALKSGGGPIKVNDPLFQQGLQIQRNIKSLEMYRGELQRSMDAAKYEQGMIAQSNQMKAQFQARQSGKVQGQDIQKTFDRTETGQAAGVNRANFAVAGQARFADSGYVNMRNAQRELADLAAANRMRLDALGITRQGVGLSAEARAIDTAIVAKKKEVTAELLRGNGETARSVQLSKELLDLEAKKKLQRQSDGQANPLLKSAAEANRVEAMLSRTQGAGGAALLKVQAALGANYLILNSITGAIRGAITNSIQLEAAFRNVQAVTDTTGTAMKGLEENIKNIASSSRFSAVEVANAALVLGQAGLSAKDIASALPSVVNLATAAGTGLAQAVDLVTSVVGVFDKTAADTVDVANKITAASNNSKVSVEKLGLAFQYVGNTAAQTGVTFEETTAAIATMSNAGITSGSTLGTGLRQFLTEVQKPSEEFLNSLRRIGLGVTDIDVKSKGLIGVVQTLREAGFVASDAIKSFDIRSAAAFNGLIANPDELRRQFEMLQNTQAAVKATEIQMNSFESQQKRLTTTINTGIANGLRPLQEILTGVFRGLSDLLSPLVQNHVLMEALTTATIAFVGVQVIGHFSGIISALLGTTGILGTAATAMRTLTTVTIAQGVASLSLSGLMGGVAASLRAFGASVALSTALVGPFATATNLAVTAVRGLVATLTSMSLLTGIGIVLAGIAGAYLLLSGNADAAKNKIDAMKASTENSKSSFDDANKSVDAVSKKIEDLIYKQTNLEGNQKGLDQTTRELNSQFGNLGFQIDANNNSFTTMIGKLRTLKAEMQVVANTRLDLQIRSQQELLQEQTNQLSDSLQKNKIGQGAGRQLERFVNTNKVLDNPGLTPSQREAIKEGIDTLKKSATPGFAQDPKNEQAMLRLTSAMENIGKVIPDAQRSAYFDITKQTANVVTQAMEVANQRSTVRGLEASRASRTADQQFQGAKLFNGKTFEEALPANRDYFDVAKRNGASSETEIFRQGKGLIEANMVEVAGIRKTLRDQLATGAIESGVFESAMAAANRREEELKSIGVKYYSNVKNRFEQDTLNEVRILEENSKNKKRYNALDRADFQRQAARLKGELALAGTFGSEERAEAKAAGAVRLGDTKAQRIEDQGDGGKGAASRILRERENALAAAARQEAADFAAAAKGNKLSATKANSYEEVDNLVDAAIQNLTQEKAKQVEALIHEQRGRSPVAGQTDDIIQKANARELEALKETADEKIRTFVEGTADIYKVVGKRSSRLGRSDSENSAAALALLKGKAEEDLFTASRPLAQSKLEVAGGYAPPGSTVQKVQELAVVQTQLRNLEEELTFYTGYIGALESAADYTKQRLDDARVALEAARGTPGEGVAQAKFGVAQSDYLNRAKDLRSAQTGQRGLRNQADDVAMQAVTLQASIPQEATWDNIQAKIKQTATVYASTVKDFDTVGAIGEGIQGSLNSLAGAFQNLFTNLATGSMSAKDAFKSFAASIIQSMLAIVTQMLAMAALKYILQSFGFAMAGGGEVGKAGTIVPMKKMAGGGDVSGGIAGKDSVPIMAMPGEFMLKKTAADAIGRDNLHQMNDMTENTMSNSGSNKSGQQKEGGVTNIWVVTPDQVPSMGPRDVLLTVADSLSQSNSPIKMLVKQIATT